MQIANKEQAEAQAAAEAAGLMAAVAREASARAHAARAEVVEGRDDLARLAPREVRAAMLASFDATGSPPPPRRADDSPKLLPRGGPPPEGVFLTQTTL